MTIKDIGCLSVHRSVSLRFGCVEQRIGSLFRLRGRFLTRFRPEKILLLVTVIDKIARQQIGCNAKLFTFHQIPPPDEEELDDDGTTWVLLD